MKVLLRRRSVVWLRKVSKIWRHLQVVFYFFVCLLWNDYVLCTPTEEQTHQFETPKKKQNAKQKTSTKKTVSSSEESRKWSNEKSQNKSSTIWRYLERQSIANCTTDSFFIISHDNPMYTSQAIVLQNINVTFDFENGKLEKIFCRDLTDRHNEPSCFTKTKRKLDKAVIEVLYLLSRKKQETTMKDVMDVFAELDIRVHYYCAVD